MSSYRWLCACVTVSSDYCEKTVTEEYTWSTLREHRTTRGTMHTGVPTNAAKVSVAKSPRLLVTEGIVSS